MLKLAAESEFQRSAEFRCVWGGDRRVMLSRSNFSDPKLNSGLSAQTVLAADMSYSASTQNNMLKKAGIESLKKINLADLDLTSALSPSLSNCCFQEPNSL